MEKKGLCITCVHDRDCTFPRKFPVLQCEEFSDSGPEGRNKQTRLPRCGIRTKLRSAAQEETIAE